MLKGFHPRRDDIFIATFLKSGTTLMQMLMYQLTTDGSMSFNHIHGRVPWIEMALGSTPGCDYLDQMPSPRVFKTHLFYDRLIELAGESARAIYVLRHPGDVLVSMYHHAMIDAGHTIPLARFLEQGFLSHPWYGGWVGHTESWWPHRNDATVVHLRYPDAVAAPEETARRLATTYGLAFSDEIATRVTERCAIAFMRQHNDKFDPRTSSLLDTPPTFIRSGTTGGWTESLSAGARVRVLDHITRVAGALGARDGAAFREAIDDLGSHARGAEAGTSAAAALRRDGTPAAATQIRA
jgi:hypothetical protein